MARLPPIPVPNSAHALRSNLVEDGGDVVHQLLDRGRFIVEQRVGEPDASHVQHEHTAERG
jgi:hypothetical protein